MNKKLQKKIDVIGINIAPALFASISALSAVHPAFEVLFVSGIGVINIWREFSQDRTAEMIEFLNDHKDSFVEDIIKSDKFKSIFLTVIEKNIKESSEKKRKILRDYLVKVASGVNEPFNNHTKLLTVLDQIIGEELRLFMLLPRIIKEYQDQRLKLSKEKDKIDEEINLTPHQIKLVLKEWNITENEIKQLFKFLSNYGLIFADERTSATYGGGSHDMHFRGITDFGSSFYNFIYDESYQEKINQLSKLS